MSHLTKRNSSTTDRDFLGKISRFIAEGVYSNPENFTDIFPLLQIIISFLAESDSASWDRC